MAVVNTARDMAGYILQIANNEQVFPKRYRWYIGQTIIDRATAVYELVIMANSTFVDSKESAERRLHYYKLAYEYSSALLARIEMAHYAIKSMTGKKAELMIGKITDTQSKIAVTITAEKKRYHDFLA